MMNMINRQSSTTEEEFYQEDRSLPNMVVRSIDSHQPEPGICPYCHQSIVTRIKKTNGILVYLASAGICLLGCMIGCCLIPFFLDGLKVCSS